MPAQQAVWRLVREARPDQHHQGARHGLVEQEALAEDGENSTERCAENLTHYRDNPAP
jgi:hypothetical protein